MYAASDKKVDETKIDPIQDVDLPAAAQADVAVPNLALTSLPPMTESERCSLEKRLKRKIDTRLLCPLVVLYILNYLDRNNLSQAADYGFKRDLHLVGNQYSTILAILFVGYILFQIPSNLLMNKVGRPRLYIPCAVAVWGVVSGLSATCSTYGHILAVRVFLGVTEAAFFPGALLLLSSWYTKRELATRTALLYSGSIISNAFSSLLATAILTMDGVRGIAGWRWLFIIEGSATVLIAFACPFILPDYPENTSFLTPEERMLAVQRLAEDAGEVDRGAGGTAKEGLVLTMTDPLVWLMALALTAATLAMSFNAFMPTVVREMLGMSRTYTLLVTATPWVFAWIVVLCNALHADHTGERTLHIIIPLVLAIVGFIMAAATRQKAVNFTGTFLMAQGYAGFVVLLSWLGSTFARPTHKRVVAIAGINAFSQLGNVASMYYWGNGRPIWQSAVICLACAAAAIALVAVIRTILVQRNKALDRKFGTVAQIDADADSVPSIELAHMRFRYLV